MQNKSQKMKYNQTTIKPKQSGYTHTQLTSISQSLKCHLFYTNVECDLPYFPSSFTSTLTHFLLFTFRGKITETKAQYARAVIITIFLLHNKVQIF